MNLPEYPARLAEFIDGKIHFLPMPNIKHQTLSGDLATHFRIYLHGKAYKIYFPLNVIIDYDFNPDSKTTLRPDLLVISNQARIEELGTILGAPALIIEILMSSNANHDKNYKYNKYLSAGVIEYWIVDPEAEEVMVNLLNKGKYETTTYTKGDIIKVFILDNLSIDVTDLFEGYQGAEIKEVEVAREEEREKAIEERERAVEIEKLAIIRRFLKMGLSTLEVAQGAEVDLDVVSRIANKMDE